MDYKKIYEEEHIKNGLSYAQIRKKYNIPRGAWDYNVRIKLNLHCDLRKHRANDDFFDIIDSEIKAYLLGFLYADGYLAKDGRMGIRLKDEDVEIIKLIQKYICPNSPIQYTNNQNIKRKPQVSIRWKSHHMYDKLMKLGFCVDKTHTDTNLFQYIPKEMKMHFLRGFTDGDGCISGNHLDNGTKRKISICWCNGTSQILQDIQKFIMPYSTKMYNHQTYYVLRCDFSRQAAAIMNMLYTNSNFYLNRKKKIVDSVLNYYNNTELT